jgi:hypothetical protein
LCLILVDQVEEALAYLRKRCQGASAVEMTAALA